MNDTHPIIEEVLDKNKQQLGKHYNKYANHVYRVFYYCLCLDDKPSHIDKYAIAAVFHDIGIWTNNTFDYLAPSIDLAKAYLLKNDLEEWTEEIELMIAMHHKISSYKGAFENTVGTFRRADWLDVSMGIKSFSINRKEIKKIKRAYPTQGFHGFLVSQACKNLLKSPLNPLPMFRR